MLMGAGLSERQSCAVAQIARSVYDYVCDEEEDQELVRRIRALARKHKRYGYRRVWALLRRAKMKVNLKRVYRLWKKLGLTLSRRPSRKRVRRGGQVPLKALYPRHVFTYDFMQDQTADGRMLKILTVVDEFTRESIAICVERRMPAAVVIEVLREAFRRYGAPEYIRSDNGPEFIAEAVQSWLAQQGTKTHYIDPASPWQNAFGESFNDKLRQECLNLEVFETLGEAKVVIARWRREYNGERPHSSLGYRTPREFRTKWEKEFSSSRAPGSLRSPGVRAREEEKLLV
jgi:putative transposase